MVKKRLYSILLSIGIVVGICGCGRNTVQYVNSEDNTEAWEQAEAENETSTEEKKPVLIYVYICGAVHTPGVYPMPEGSRICDLFEVAGGLTDSATDSYWNQARVLVDGEMIYVPTRKEAEERTVEERAAAAGMAGITEKDNDKDGKVNLNNASKEELMTLPGIGEARALAILSYRQENGGFSTVDELKQIAGIKDGIFSRIKDYIVID